MIDQYKFSCLEQGSEEWLKARLGYFSGSQIGLLMKKGRNCIFSDTAMGYIYEVAAKRRLLDAFRDGEGWQDYCDRVTLKGRALQWGKDFEPYAREEYISRNKEFEVAECGFILHREIEWLGDSPDGIICKESHPIGALEIKCPDSKTWMRYYDELSIKRKSLKEVNADYYYQCLCHIAVNDVQFCDFVAYDPMLRDGYLQHRIERRNATEDIATMLANVQLANDIIKNLI